MRPGLRVAVQDPVSQISQGVAKGEHNCHYLYVVSRPFIVVVLSKPFRSPVLARISGFRPSTSLLTWSNVTGLRRNSIRLPLQHLTPS